MLEIVACMDCPRPQEAQASLSLPWELRQRSRQLVTLDDGRQAALMLPRGASLRDGDLLRTTLGELVRVRACPEDLSVAVCPGSLDLARACYHLGNRHVPAQITEGAVLYQRDHVLDDMLRGLGMEIRTVRAAFQPESGAYHGHHHGL